MNILCCYINPQLSVTALESFGAYAPGVAMVNCTGDWTDRESMKVSMTRYWREIYDRWTGEEDLVILSQHQGVDGDTIPGLDKCENLLCYNRGAVRYRTALQRQVPRDDIGGDYMVWHLVNERLSKLWEMHQVTMCVHS
jgi:hypothetical protein